MTDLTDEQRARALGVFRAYMSGVGHDPAATERLTLSDPEARADPLAARIARETVHDLASAERIVADARQRNLTDDQITTMHERGTLTACLAAFASIDRLARIVTRED